MGDSCFWLADIKKNFSSETAWPNELIFDRKQLWEVLYKISSFRPDPSTNVAAIGNSHFWLADIEKFSPLKQLGQMNWSLTWSNNERSFIKFPHFHFDSSTNMATMGESCFWLANIERFFFSETAWIFDRSIYERSFIKFTHFVTIHLQTWPK